MWSPYFAHFEYLTCFSETSIDSAPCCVLSAGVLVYLSEVRYNRMYIYRIKRKKVLRVIGLNIWCLSIDPFGMFKWMCDRQVNKLVGSLTTRRVGTYDNEMIHRLHSLCM